MSTGLLVTSLQALPTPGHTPGHVAFFRGKDRMLIRRSAVSYLLGCGTVTVQLTFGFTPV